MAGPAVHPGRLWGASVRFKAQGELARNTGFRLRADLDMDLDGVAALVGASGSGKSTLLRVIAGFEPDAPVTVEIDAETWQGSAANLAAHLRPVGTVFQEARLFPHLDARSNLTFAAHAKRTGVRLGLDEVVDFLDLEPLLGQYPRELSGGQRQRVALGRTLLSPAKLWLFDEPMSALDSASRREIAPYLARLCRRHDVPIIYVSHTLSEVLTMADQVMVAVDGDVSRVDSVGDFSTSFSTPSLGDEAGAVVSCRFKTYDPRYRLSELGFGPSSLFVRGDLSSAGPLILLHIPARDVSLATTPIDRLSILNRVDGVVDAIDDQGDSAMARVRCGDGQFLLARVTRRSVDELGLAAGVDVQALIKSVAVRTGAP